MSTRDKHFPAVVIGASRIVPAGFASNAVPHGAVERRAVTRCAAELVNGGLVKRAAIAPRRLRGSAFPESAALGLVVSVLIKRAHIARSKFQRTRGRHFSADIGKFEANIAPTTEGNGLVKD